MVRVKFRDFTMHLTIGSKLVFLSIHEMNKETHCINSYRLIITPQTFKESYRLVLAQFWKTAFPVRVQLAVYAHGKVGLALKIERQRLNNGMKLTKDAKMTWISVVILIQRKWAHKIKLSMKSQSTWIKILKKLKRSRVIISVNSLSHFHQILTGD